jgi:hypothetical protein
LDASGNRLCSIADIQILLYPAASEPWQNFLKKNEKANLQWTLELELQEFEVQAWQPAERTVNPQANREKNATGSQKYGRTRKLR